jgi:hypothetical protein
MKPSAHASVYASDRAIWGSWYDVPAESTDAYLAWLHASYLPQVLERKGSLWAAHYAAVEQTQRPHWAREGTLKRVADPAVPVGRHYILLIGATDANVFGEPDWRKLDAALPEADRRMLALRQSEYVNVMVEAARVEGPAAASYADGMLPPPCIQIGNFNIDWKDEPDVLAWYANWRMPAVRELPGVVRTRRLCSVAGWAKHGVFYEFTSLAMRNQHFVRHEDANPDAKAYSDRMVQKLTHAPASSTLATRLWPPVKDPGAN